MEFAINGNLEDAAAVGQLKIGEHYANRQATQCNRRPPLGFAYYFRRRQHDARNRVQVCARVFDGHDVFPGRDVLNRNLGPSVAVPQRRARLNRRHAPSVEGDSEFAAVRACEMPYPELIVVLI